MPSVHHTLTQLRASLLVAVAGIDAALAAISSPHGARLPSIAPAPRPRHQSLRQAVLRAVECQDGEFGTREIAAILHRERQGVDERRVGQYLSRLAGDGTLERVRRGGAGLGNRAIYRRRED